MKSRTRYARYIASLISGSVLVAASVTSAFGNGPQANPAGTPAVGGVVLQTDGRFGYEMLRPSAWSAVEAGVGRGFVDAKDPANARMGLMAANLSVTANGQSEETVAQWEAFRKNDSLDGWTAGNERIWRTNGVDFTLVETLPNAKVYLATRDTQRSLVAYVIDQGQPLMVSLGGTASHPSFESLDQLRTDGLLTDFLTMVKSVRAIPVDPSSGEQVVPLSSGPWYGNTGTRPWPGGADGSYQLRDTYHQQPPTTNELYSWIGYGGYLNWWAYIFRTEITDNPGSTCSDPGAPWTLFTVSYPSSLHTTTTPYVSVDSWPNHSVAHLNRTTAHMTVFGPIGAAYCGWYYPYTH